MAIRNVWIISLTSYDKDKLLFNKEVLISPM